MLGYVIDIKYFDLDEEQLVVEIAIHNSSLKFLATRNIIMSGE